jgi:hypothetical protein
LPVGRQPGLSLQATKGDEAQPAMFFKRAELALALRGLFKTCPADTVATGNKSAAIFRKRIYTV